MRACRLRVSLRSSSVVRREDGPSLSQALQRRDTAFARYPPPPYQQQRADKGMPGNDVGHEPAKAAVDGADPEVAEGDVP